jgi:hydrogenase maturation protease
MNTQQQENILVIGMGNILMQDEGIGVRVLEELECRYHIKGNIELMDGGTTGTELLEPIRQADILIVTDAINTGDKAGTLVRIADDQVPMFFQTKISNHQLGLSDLLAILTLQNQAPKHVIILGMVPHFLENKLGLSDEATAGLEVMLKNLCDELLSLGIELLPKQQVTQGFWARQAELESRKCA